jgi:hypothetical protein
MLQWKRPSAKNNARHLAALVDAAREIDVVEQRGLDRRVSADFIVRSAVEEQELAIRERPPAGRCIGERQRILAHQLERRGRLHDALEPARIAERAQQAQQIELAFTHQRKRCGDAPGFEFGIGIGEQQIVGCRRTARARDARMQRMHLPGPVGGQLSISTISKRASPANPALASAAVSSVQRSSARTTPVHRTSPRAASGQALR